MGPRDDFLPVTQRTEHTTTETQLASLAAGQSEHDEHPVGLVRTLQRILGVSSRDSLEEDVGKVQRDLHAIIQHGYTGSNDTVYLLDDGVLASAVIVRPILIKA